MTIIEAMEDKELFLTWFEDSTWSSWASFLRVMFALPMDQNDLLTYAKHGQRTHAPERPFQEAWLIVGRRGGKSIIAALVAVFLACFRDYSAELKPGEFGTVMVIAADRRQARVILRYVKGFLDIPMLRQLVIGETKEAIELSNNVVIEIHTASFRSTRGYTLIAAICDEIAFWQSDDSANPDIEIVNALRPGLATIPGSLLLCISSPYARRGALWNAYRRYYGQDNDRVLTWHATTRDMNPSIDQNVIDQALAEDEASARAEYMAEFRRDIDGYIDREHVESLVPSGVLEVAPVQDTRYRAFVDPAGGSGQDSMTLAIAHRDRDRAILNAVREIRPPFSPENAVDEFAHLLKKYSISSVTGDRYAGEWPRERFRKAGIQYKISEKVRSDLYRDLLPMLNSASVQLLDNARLIAQLSALERRTSRSGRDSIDHGPHGHDDIANATAGALVMALKPGLPKLKCY